MIETQEPKTQSKPFFSFSVVNELIIAYERNRSLLLQECMKGCSSSSEKCSFLDYDDIDLYHIHRYGGSSLQFLKNDV